MATATAPEARLLVVDDEPSILELLSFSLRFAGFEVATATNGVDALNTARTFAPDLLVLDVMLPAIDGLEVCRRLHEHSQAPIVLLTARGDEADKVHGFGFGADDYLVKPFSPRARANAF